LFGVLLAMVILVSTFASFYTKLKIKILFGAFLVLVIFQQVRIVQHLLKDAFILDIPSSANLIFSLHFFSARF
jgi:hypothetical protein